MRRRGLTLRATVACVVLAVVVTGGFVVLAGVIQSLRSQEESNTDTSAVLTQSSVLEMSVLDMQTGVRGYVITGQQSFLRPYRMAVAIYPGQVRQLDRLTAGDPSAQHLVAAIGTAIDSYVVDRAGPVISQATTSLAAARRTIAAGGSKQRVQLIRGQFTALNRHEQAMFSAQATQAERTGTVSLAFGLAGAIVSLILIAALAIGLRRVIVLPVNQLAAAFGRLRRSELSARVPARGMAEMGQLATGFNAMAQELEAGRDELEQQNAELQGQQIELGKALESVEEQKEKAEVLHEFGIQLAAQTEIEEVAAVTLRDMGQHAGADLGALYVLNEQSGDFTLRAVRGSRPGDLPAVLPPGDGLAGRVIGEKRAIAAGPAEGSLRVPGLVNEREIRHEAHVPLLHRERVIGVISLGRSSDEEFTAADLAGLGDLAVSAALACAEALGLRRLEVLARELEAVVDSTDEGILRLDLEGIIGFVNRAALEQTGFQADELLGRTAHEMLHHSYPDKTPYPERNCPIARCLRGGIRARLSSEEFWRKDGSHFPVECSAYPMYDGDVVVGGVVTFVDVRDRRLAEREIAAQYRTARVLADAKSVEDALPRVLGAACEELGWQVGLGWLTDDDDAELHCVATYASAAQVEQAAKLGREPLVVGQATAGAAWQRRQPVLVSGPASNGQLPAPGGTAPPPGGPAPLLGADLAVPLIRGGDVMGVIELVGSEYAQPDVLIKTVETVASQVAQYAARQQSEAAAVRVKDQFVATVSHELRTPLAAMDGWLHILLDGDPGPLNDEQRRFLTTVKRNSDRLMRLVGDLLLIGQMDAGRFSLDLGDVDLAELVSETVALFAGTAAEKGVEMTSGTCPGAVVHGDRLRLGQLLSNLVSNAIKFTPTGGQVSVSVAEHDGTCQLEVTDSGIGIPVAERGHLFERFYRASTATGTAGSGLGLAISKAIAEAHGGTIRIGDSGGSGTRFTADIPLAVTAEARL